jgi:hypothetical protein
VLDPSRTASSALFLKYGTHRHINYRRLRREKRSCRGYSAPAVPKTLKKGGRSASLPEAVTPPQTGSSARVSSP